MFMAILLLRYFTIICHSEQVNGFDVLYEVSEDINSSKKSDKSSDVSAIILLVYSFMLFMVGNYNIRCAVRKQRVYTDHI